MDQEGILRAIVRIHAYGRSVNFVQPFQNAELKKSVGTGSFVEPPSDLAERAQNRLFVLTCAHVVDAADSVSVLIPLLSQNTEVPATVVSFVPEYDLAVLMIQDTPEGAYRSLTRTLPIGSSNALKLKDKLTAYGFPLGHTALKVSDGVYAGFQHLLQHTVSISPGNSGGPLVDAQDRIVGVNSSAIVAPEASDIFYAVPIEFFIVQKPRMFSVVPPPSFPPGQPAHAPEKVMRLPTFGLYFQEATESQVRHITGTSSTSPLGAGCCTTGVYIYSVLPDSPAWRHGVRKGDLLCSFDGAQVDNTGEVQVPWNYQKVQVEHVLHRATDLTKQYKFTLFQSRRAEADARGCTDILLSPEVLTRNGLATLFPPYDAVNYVVLMGVCMMPLVRNHMVIPETIAAYACLKPEELALPKLVITYIFNGTAAQRSEALVAGDLVAKVNGVEVHTLEQARAAFSKPLQDGMVCIEVMKGRSLMLAVSEVLSEEAAHARFEPPLYQPATDVLEALHAVANTGTSL